MMYSSPLPGLQQALLLQARARQLQSEGRLQDAGNAYQQAIAICPRHAGSYCDLTAMLLERGDATNAARVISALPAPVYAASNQARHLHAVLLVQQGDHARATDLMTGLIDAPDIDQAALLQNLGTCFNRQEDLERALGYYQRAFAAGAMSAAFYSDWAGVLQKLEDLPAAFSCYREALRRYPRDAGLRYEFSLLLLKTEQYAEGFRLYASRWQAPAHDARPAAMPLPQWNGRKPIRSLLILPEQGVGDQIVYSALLPAALQALPRVTVAFDSRLSPLLLRSFPNLNVLTASMTDVEVRQHFDACAYAADLGAFFPEAVHWEGAWLRPDPERTDRLKEKYRTLFPGKHLVGISWKSQRAQYGERKGPALEAWRTVLQQADCQFISLQYGDITDDLALARERLGVEIHVDPEIDAFNDLDGLAAQANAMDRVITSSNSSAHLAAASGAPTWVLLSRGSSLPWYWGFRAREARWYPQARLFRSTGPSGWPSALEEIATTLRESIA